MTDTLASQLSVSIKHAARHLRNGEPRLAEIVLKDAQDIIDEQKARDAAGKRRAAA